MSVLSSARYSIVCLRGCHCDLCQRVLICRGKAVFGSSEWPKTQGSRDSQAMIRPPVERRDGTPLSADGGVHWD